MSAASSVAPTATAAVFAAIGPAHDPIAPAMARTSDDLAAYAERFDACVEVYSPAPRDELALLAPLLVPGKVALLFAPEGGGRAAAELERDGSSLRVRLVVAPECSRFYGARPVQYIAGFVVDEADLADGVTLASCPRETPSAVWPSGSTPASSASGASAA